MILMLVLIHMHILPFTGKLLKAFCKLENIKGSIFSHHEHCLYMYVRLEKVLQHIIHFE